MSTAEFPPWLHLFAIATVAVGFACSSLIAVDVVRHPQKMTVMNLVWPLTALFGGPLWLWLYWRFGRPRGRGMEETDPPFWAIVAKGASHCGAGCALGDIVAEWAAFALPTIAVWFGWHSLFSEKIFAVWIVDYIVAFLLGVAFQYFTIVPMRDLSPGRGIVAAAKADFLSITSWQVGMYGLMAILQFAWFKQSFGGVAEVDTPEFWSAMQFAMVAGFFTAYPTNWWLIRAGFKEKM